MGLILALLTLIGAFLYRIRGGMAPHFPRPIDQALCAIPYGIIVLMSCGWLLGLLTFVLTTAMFARAHGNTMDLGDFDREPEWYEFLIRPWLFDKVPLYWYDLIGHSISGLVCTLPAGILTLNPFLALSGALKGPAYALGKAAGSSTEGGELLTGAVLWVCVWYYICGM